MNNNNRFISVIGELFPIQCTNANQNIIKDVTGGLGYWISLVLCMDMDITFVSVAEESIYSHLLMSNLDHNNIRYKIDYQKNIQTRASAFITGDKTHLIKDFKCKWNINKSIYLPTVEKSEALFLTTGVSSRTINSVIRANKKNKSVYLFSNSFEELLKVKVFHNLCAIFVITNENISDNTLFNISNKANAPIIMVNDYDITIFNDGKTSEFKCNDKPVASINGQAFLVADIAKKLYKHEHIITAIEDSYKGISKLTTKLDKTTVNHDQTKQLENLLYKDGLTGLLNRTGFNHRIANTCFKEDHYVVMIDFDEFKTVNDTHGHLVGDNALKAVAMCLESIVDRDHICARFGGDEFVLVIKSQSRNFIQSTLERLQTDIYNMQLLDKNPYFKISVSIGFSKVDKSLPFIKSMEQADDALYASKDSDGKKSTVCAA